METNQIAPTFESVDKIVWYDHSNKTSSAVLSHGTFDVIIQMKPIWHNFCIVQFIFFEDFFTKN